MGSLGPSEITVFVPRAFESMDGPKSKTTRSDWYDLLYPRVSSVFTRDQALHDDRRRIWSHSLSTQGKHALEITVFVTYSNRYSLGYLPLSHREESFWPQRSHWVQRWKLRSMIRFSVYPAPLDRPARHTSRRLQPTNYYLHVPATTWALGSYLS